MKKYLLIFLFLSVGCFQLFAQKDTEENSQNLFEQNKIYPRTNVVPYYNEGQIPKLNYVESPFFLSLNGEWSFSYYKNQSETPVDFFVANFNDTAWEELNVPACWEIKGFGEATYGQSALLNNPPDVPENANSVGLYRRTFEVSKDWKEQLIFLHIGAAASDVMVWVNGKYVGYSQDAATPSEFEISKFLKVGMLNTIALKVKTYSSGSYLENWQSPTFHGVTGDVFLYSKPMANIYDYSVSTKLDKKLKNGELAVNVKIQNKASYSFLSSSKQYTVEIELWDDRGEIVEKFYKTAKIKKKEDFVEVSFNEYVASAKYWSTEMPYLYTLIIRLKDNKQNDLDVTGCNIGFRNIEMENGVLLLNGKPLKIKGINYTTLNDTLGNVYSQTDLLTDLRMMKENNINAIFLRDYPANPNFYNLCDRYGFYVFNEANASINPAHKIMKDATWSEQVVSRIRNVYERDKNHTSVVAWSLGNSYEYGVVFEEAYKWLKEKETIRPVVYKGSETSWYSDIYLGNCLTVNDFDSYGLRTQKKPLIASRFLPSYGNGMGGVAEYWNKMIQYPQLQGAFVSNWVDQALTYPKQNDTTNYYAFGYSNEFNTKENAFLGGLVMPNRKPHPQLAELKNTFRNFSVRPIDIVEGEFEVTNLNDFQNLKDFELNYRIFSNLKPSVSEGDLTIDAAPGQKAVFNVTIPQMNTYSNEEYFIIFTLRQKQDMQLVSKSHEYGFQQFKLKMKNTQRVLIPESEMLEVDFKEDSAHIWIYNNTLEFIFDKKTALINRLRYREEDIFSKAPQLSFWRLPTQNDKLDENGERVWKATGLDQLRAVPNNIFTKSIDENTARIVLGLDIYNRSNELIFNIFQTYTVYGTGDIFIENKIKPAALVQNLPKVGMQMQVSKEFDTVQWFGYENETYPDRSQSGEIGVYSMRAEQIYHPYLIPQESGNRMETRWMCMRDTEKQLGILFDANQQFNFSIYPYDMQDLQNAKSNANLQPTNDYTVNFDYKQAPIGSAVCGEGIEEKYTIDNKEQTFALHIRPFDTEDSKPDDYRLSKFNYTSEEVMDIPVIKANRSRFDSVMHVSLVSEIPDAKIHYTLDGTEPTEKSLLYTHPIEIYGSTMLMARAFKQGFAPSFTVKETFNFMYAKNITYQSAPNTPYNKNLETLPFDNVYGKGNNFEKNWLGFSGNDFGATIELIKPIELQSVEIGFGHAPETWVFLPTEVTVATSEDGTNFSSPIQITLPFDPAQEKTDKAAAVQLKALVNKPNIRFIRITGKNLGKLPTWHPNKGLRPWIMLDEIVIEEKIAKQPATETKKAESKK